MSGRYDKATATATRLIAKYGSLLSFQGKPTPSDPVTGAGGGAGGPFEARAVLTGVKDGVFAEGLRKAGDRMLVIEGSAPIKVGAVWVDGSNHWPIVDLVSVKPDNGAAIVHKALVRG